jgi:hypothetical protein
MNSMPFRQLKSFLKILIGVQYKNRTTSANSRDPSERRFPLMEEKGEYTQYPEAFERLLKELNFPTDNEAVKRVLLSITINSLLHY